MITKKPLILFYIILFTIIISAILGFIILPNTKYQLATLFFSHLVMVPFFIFSVIFFIISIISLKSGIKQNKKEDKEFGVLGLIFGTIFILLFGWMLNNYFLDGFGARQIEVTKKAQLHWCSEGSKNFSCEYCIDIEGDTYHAFCGYYDSSDLKYLGYSEYDENRPMIEYKLKILEHSRLILDAKKVE